MRKRILKRVVDALEPRADGDLLVWDSELRGFGVRMTPAGVKSYVLQYRYGGRSRRMTIGKHGPFTCDSARKRAKELLGLVAADRDPLAEIQARRSGQTVSALADRYLREHAEPKKKPSSVASDKRLLKAHIRPKLGAIRVADVTRRDVAALHHSLRETPIAANRTLALLSKLMNLAERWGLRPDGSNPCRHVERNPERRRERFLSSAEFARLGASLSALEDEGKITRSCADAIRLLALTGARRGEVCTLRWEYVDRERSCLRLPDSKTGAKTIPLSAPALQVLSSRPRASEWCFPTERGDTPIDLSRPWDRVRDRAKLPGVRIHDLRHSTASVLAAQGESFAVIGRLLGHKSPATTARYAHLSDDPLRSAVERAGEQISRSMAVPSNAAQA